MKTRIERNEKPSQKERKYKFENNLPAYVFSVTVTMTTGFFLEQKQ